MTVFATVSIYCSIMYVKLGFPEINDNVWGVCDSEGKGSKLTALAVRLGTTRREFTELPTCFQP